MRVLLLASLGVCCLLLASCSSGSPGPASGSSKPQDLLIGKWEMVGITSGLFEEYSVDGRVVKSRDGQVLGDFEYRFVDDGTIEYRNKGQTSNFKVAVTTAELTLTAPDGKVLKYKRVK